MSHYPTHLLSLARAVVPEATRISDAELLRRFTEVRDTAAFELLLWRHGPMVWGVCRRQLSNSHDAEDAFQTACLALARHGSSISEGDSLAAWLYRVALHAALAIRKASAQRIRRESLTADPPERVATDDPTRAAVNEEMGRLIDEEIGRLPDKLRLPFLLCEVQGRCHAAVAAELRCPVGTVESRLHRARQRLRTQLSRRGLALPAGLAVAVPGTLRANARRLVAHPTASVPGPVRALARQAARAALPARTLMPAGACLLAVCVGLVVLVGSKAGPAPGQPKTPSLPVRLVRAAPAEPPLPAGAVARIGSTRLRHDGQVTSVAFSPDGRWIATADEKSACVWDAVSGKLRHRLRSEKIERRKVAFSPDGKLLLTLGQRKGEGRSVWLRQFDLKTGKELPPRTPLAGRPNARFLGALSADGKLFGYQDIGGYRIHDAATERLLQTVPLPQPGWMAPVLAPGGKAVALASGTKSLKVFDIGTGKVLRVIDEDKREIYSAAFSRDGKVLGTLSSDNSAGLWDLKTGKLIRRITGLEVTSYALAFSPDGKRLAVGNLQRLSVQLIDATTGKELRRFRSWPSVKQVVFSPDGKSLAAGRTIGTVSVWDVKTGKPRPCSANPDNGAFTLRFTSKGLLVVASDIAVHDWRTGKIVRRHPDPRTICFDGFALSEDGRWMAQAEFDGSIRLLDATTGMLVHTLKGHTNLASPLLFSPDGKRLFSRGCDATVRIWEVKGGKELHKFTAGSNSSGGRLAVSPDGKMLAMAVSEAGRPVVRLWDRVRGQPLHQWTPATGALIALAFAPDGSLLAGIGAKWENGKERSGTVSLWDTKSGARRRELTVPEPLYSVAFSGDGRTLATGGHSLRLWEVASGKERHLLYGPRDGIYALAFSKDGKHLASASSDAPVLVWAVYGPGGARAPALQRQWEALSASDAVKGFQGVRWLIARPDEAVALCRKHLAPAPATDEKRLRKLLADLDHDRFAVRQRASDALRKLGATVEPALRSALAKAKSPETKKRLTEILARLEEPGPKRLRELRALEVLEQVATPAAVKLLDNLARGAATSRLTREAAAARDRLRRR